MSDFVHVSGGKSPEVQRERRKGKQPESLITCVETRITAAETCTATPTPAKILETLSREN